MMVSFSPADMWNIILSIECHVKTSISLQNSLWRYLERKIQGNKKILPYITFRRITKDRSSN